MRGRRGELESLDSNREMGQVPEDPVEFCRGWLGYESSRYMWPFLRDESHFIALLQARQTGKTFNGMAKLLWYAFLYCLKQLRRTATSVGVKSEALSTQ